MAQNDFESAPVIAEVENFDASAPRGDRNGASESVIPTKLYVKRIPESVTSKELNDLFAAYGNVTECAIIRSYAFIVCNSCCLVCCCCCCCCCYCCVLALL